jgi:replicative DNA helicase
MGGSVVIQSWEEMRGGREIHTDADGDHYYIDEWEHPVYDDPSPSDQRSRSMPRSDQRVAPSAIAGADSTGGVARSSLASTVRLAARKSVTDGATFVLSEWSHPEPVWGTTKSIAWAEGESLLLNGPTGVGKTTLAQQLALGRLGIRSKVLELPVMADDRHVLYIAADRPRQAARSFRRMVDERDRTLLHERLRVWKGPLPCELVKHPEIILTMAEMFEAGTIIIDSLKDVAPNLSEEDVGGAVNLATQLLVAEEIEVLALHHQRKQSAGGGPRWR